MASNRGYTTATKVRDKLAGMVNGYFTDAMIEAEINRVEGAIDAALGITTSGNNEGGFSFTWTTARSVHWVVEAAATYGAALGIAGPCAYSWNTLDQLVNAQQTFAYMFGFYFNLIEGGDTKDFIRSE